MTTADTRFYFTGGNLDRDAPSYIERQADRELYEALSQGEFCYVLDSRQMGKSSLMVRTAARLRSAGVRIAALDLTALGQNLSPEQWYLGLLLNLGRALNLEDEVEAFWEVHERLSPLQRWMAALREIVLKADGRRQTADGSPTKTDQAKTVASADTTNYRLPTADCRLVIFIDEIDAVRSLPFSTDEFFAAIRECYNRRTREPEFHRVTFCLLGVATPSDLIRDTRTTPFNIGRRIELTDFTPEEAAPLAQGLGARASRSPAQGMLQRVLYWTGGHPYLTQRLCRAIAEAIHPNPKSVDRLCTELFLSHRGREQDDNLVFVRERLLRALTPEGAPVDRAALLELYGRVRRGEKVPADRSDPLVEILRLSGVARTAGSVLRVRNLVYAGAFDRAWVTQHMPGGEVRRQRAAFRRGVLRAAAVAALIVACMAGLSGIAVTQARRAERQRRVADQQRRIAEAQRAEARRNLYAAQIHLAQQAWETEDIVQARRLLESWRPDPGQEDLRGFEWRLLWGLCQDDASSTFRGHAEGVSGVAISPDGKRFATAGLDGSVKLWDIASGQVLASLEGHTDEVRSVSFSPDGKTLASGSWDRTIRLWDVEHPLRPGDRPGPAARPGTGPALRAPAPSRPRPARAIATLTGHTDQVLTVAFSPNGKLLASGGEDRTVKLWDLVTRREIATLTGHTGGVRAVAFSPDGRRLVSASTDQTARLWDLASRQELATLSGHKDWLRGAAFSPDGRTLATVSDDGTLKLWDVTTRRATATLRGHRDHVNAVAFSPDGKTIATGGWDRLVKLWDVATRTEVRTFKGHTEGVWSVAFSPDGKSLFSSSDDSTVRLWNPAAAGAVVALPKHPAFLDNISFAPDGRTLATMSGDGTARLWDVASRQQIAWLKRRLYRPLLFSPDNRFLVWRKGKETVELWEIAARRPWAELPGIVGERNALTFSPDGRLLAFGSTDKTVKLWDLTSRRVVATLKGYTKGVSGVTFSPDGRLLAALDAPRGSLVRGSLANVWDVATQREVFRLPDYWQPGPPFAFGPDGKTLVTRGRSSTVKWWDLATKRPVATLKTPGFGAAVASPDGKTLATARENTVTLWNLSIHQEVAALKGPPAMIDALAFSPDGDTLAVGSADGAVRLWRAVPPHEADPLQVIAAAGDRIVRLQWRPAPSAMAYNVYRGPADARSSPLSRLNHQPVAGVSFADQSPELANGRPQTYGVAALYRSAAGKLEEGPKALLQATPMATIPGFWANSINEGDRSGSVRFEPATGELQLRGSGADVAGPADGCYFMSAAVTGDFQIIVQAVTPPSHTNDWAKAGLMIRESLDPGSRVAYLFLIAASRPVFQGRDTSHEWLGAHSSPRPPLKLPALLRLTRRGNTITAEYSTDSGRHFDAVVGVMEFEEPLPPTLYAGLAITAHDISKISVAQFRGLEIRKLKRM